MSAALALAPRRASAPPPGRAAALAALRDGRIALAAGTCDALLAESPDDAELHHLRGVIAGRSGDPRRALPRIRRAVALDAGVARYHVDLAATLQALGRLDEAEEAATRAVAIDAAMPAAWAALGAVRAAGGDGVGGAAAFRRALALDPGHAAANAGLGALLRAAGRPDEAGACFRAALRAEPRSAAAAAELGRCFAEAGDGAAAESWFAAAARLDPGLLEPHLGLADARERAGDLPGAIAHLRDALSLAPDSVRARWRLALNLLRAGELAEGWALFEHGIGVAGYRGPARPYALRRPRGAPRRALLWGEGDLAAEILFAGLVPDLAAAGAGGVLECDPLLAALFRRSFPDFVVVARGDRPAPAARAGEFDLALPTASLGGRLRPDLAAFPARRAYLRPDMRLVDALRARYAAGGAKLVGIAAAGIDAPLPEIVLSIKQFAGGAGGAPRLVALDAAAARAGALADPEIDLAGDLDARAAQLAAMDSVVAGDGPLAHLAGALGAPAVVALPAAGAARWWFAGRADSPWYPSLDLRRGSTPGSPGATVAAAPRPLRRLPA